jgi:hypothetical protein
MSSPFVSSSQKVWEAWQLSKTYNARPSELYGISHPVQQFFFDRAVYVFGTTLESDLEKAGEKAKKPKQAEQARMRVLQKWLGTEVIGFREPAPTRQS